jgi:hypothetical protein
MSSSTVISYTICPRVTLKIRFGRSKNLILGTTWYGRFQRKAWGVSSKLYSPHFYFCFILQCNMHYYDERMMHVCSLWNGRYRKRYISKEYLNMNLQTTGLH